MAGRVPRREPAVRGRLAAAGLAAVDHVVMYQGARVQQLQRGGGGQDTAAIRIIAEAGAAGRAPSPVAERGPQHRPLPTEEPGQHAPDLISDLGKIRSAARHYREGSPARPGAGPACTLPDR